MFRAALISTVLVLGSLVTAIESSAASRPGRVYWGLDAGAAHQFAASLSNADGTFSMNRYFVEPSVGYAWSSRNRISLSLAFGEADYDFSSAATIAGLEPWGRVRDYRLSLPVRFAPTERTDVYLRPSIRSYAEDGASVQDGTTGGLMTGISWRVSDSLLIGPGIGWYSKLGGGSHVFPVLIIDWQITDRLSLTTGRGLAASQGPGLSLNYRLSDRWQLGLTGRIESARFVLDNDGSPDEAYGKDRSLPLLVSIDYEPWPMTSVGAFIGAEFDGQLSLEDEDGRKIARQAYGVAPLIGVAFSSRF